MEERLQKYIASSGYCSRRKAEEYIKNGKVKVNGKVEDTLGTKVNPEKDIVEVNNKVVKPQENKVYILLNKPIAYVSTRKDQFSRDTIMDLVKVKEKVLPVGRLDMYTSGAIILTNDGEFLNKVSHPKNEIAKTYNVTVKGQVTEEEIQKLKDGVEIVVDEVTYNVKADKIKILKIDQQKDISRIQITIHEGKNKEVRRMMSAIDRKVLALHRVSIENITVKSLKLGEWRYLTDNEVKMLMNKKVKPKQLDNK